MFFEIGVLRNQIDKVYFYRAATPLATGQVVAINFNSSSSLGVAFKEADTPPSISGNIKYISDAFPYIIPIPYLQFITKFAKYNLIPFGSALKLIIPFTPTSIKKFGRELKGIAPSTLSTPSLTEEQQNAIHAISKHLSEFSPVLLHGVTGSGKTEVFLTVAQKIFDSHNQILILVPEISLSNALAKSVSNRLNTETYIWHNSIATNSKLSIWRKAIAGESIVVIGARSALFIPFHNLKLIIVDEEHDTSFKQNDHQIYHGRDMAVLLASELNIPIILSSATPSLESFHNAKIGKYKYVQLTERYESNLPKIVCHSMLGTTKSSIFSPQTIEEIKRYLDDKQQILIFINRRGYTPRRLCPNCGWKAQCDACDSWLCFHKSKEKLCCHYCGAEKENITVCPECRNPYLTDFGLGIEKLFTECQHLFPQARVLQCSSDNMNTPNKIEKTIKQIANHEADIVLGTQVLAKGHNFPDLNLVVIANLDDMLYGEDFRACEHTWQLISQVSGRAGRFDKNSGKVIIQTFAPEDRFLQLLIESDQNAFYLQELKNRQLTRMPPFGCLTNIELSSESESTALNQTNEILRQLPRVPNLTILGPVKPLISKLKFRYRFRIILVSSFRPQAYISKFVKPIPLPYNIRLKIDLNPFEFL